MPCLGAAGRRAHRCNYRWFHSALSQMKTLIESARWRRSQIAETFASVRVSASFYRLTKDVFVLPVIESKSELIEGQGQVFSTDVVEGTDHPALEKAPKGFNVLGMYFAAHVDAALMLAQFVGVAVLAEAIGQVFIGCHQRDALETVSRTNPSRVSRRVLAMTLQTTFALRAIAPITGILPEASPPDL
jgi:hypothetical protein